MKFGNKAGQVGIRDVPVPTIGDEDVLLATRAVGICGWDIEMWQHTMANPVTVPVVMGHEFCGVIEQVGRDIKYFEPGDRVVSETAAVVCGRCPQCVTGNYHLCTDRKGFGYGVDGAFTDYVRVPARCLHRIPDGVSFEHACLAEPACVAYQALVVLSDVRPGRPVLVIGPGPIGLFCVQIAKAAGAGPIVIAGTDNDAKRLNTARELGADHIVHVSSDEPVKAVLKVSEGQGFPVVADAAGNSRSLKLAIDAVGRGGQVTKIGWGPKPVDFSLDPLLAKAARLQGTFSHNWPTWEAVLRMIAGGKIRMEPMISRRMRLEEWQETFEAVERCDIIKAVMCFNS